MSSGKVAAVSFALNPFRLKHIMSHSHQNVLLQQLVVVMINGSAFRLNPLIGNKNLNSLSMGGVGRNKSPQDMRYLINFE